MNEVLTALRHGYAASTEGGRSSCILLQKGAYTHLPLLKAYRLLQFKGVQVTRIVKTY